MSRILHIVGDSKYGGASVLIKRLAIEGKNAGHEVGVLTTDSIFQDHLKELGVEVVDLQCIWRDTRPVRDFLGLFCLVRYLIRSKWDMVHTHTSKGGVIGRISSTIARVPTIIHTTHGFAFHEKSPRWQIYIFTTAEQIAAYFCHKIVYVSRFHCDWAKYLRIGSSEQRIAIPNGIPSPSDGLKRKNIGPIAKKTGITTPLRCLTVGRLAPQKGLETLIDAVSLIGQSNVDVHFRIAGDGPSRESIITKMKATGLDNRFNLLGFRSDVEALLSNADIIIQPSIREGLSIVLLEAMRLGKPIIAAAIGSNLEASNYGQAADLFEAGNSKALAAAIQELVNNEQRRVQLGKCATKRFQEHYTEERMISDYLRLYKSLES